MSETLTASVRYIPDTCSKQKAVCNVISSVLLVETSAYYPKVFAGHTLFMGRFPFFYSHLGRKSDTAGHITSIIEYFLSFNVTLTLLHNLIDYND